MFLVSQQQKPQISCSQPFSSFCQDVIICHSTKNGVDNPIPSGSAQPLCQSVQSTLITQNVLDPNCATNYNCATGWLVFITTVFWSL